MQQFELGTTGQSTKFDHVSREALIEKFVSLEELHARLSREFLKLKNQQLSDNQLNLVLGEYLADLQNKMFGSSSEKYKKRPKTEKTPKDPKPRVRLPSERYPNVPVREVPVSAAALSCVVCRDEAKETGLFEVSEQLTVIPKKYEIIRNVRSKLGCSCQSCLVTAAIPPRIIPGSTYSDEMIEDVALSKYCDLIPIERYVQMANRGGLVDLPANSLIELTHSYADFVSPMYQMIKFDLLNSRVLNADETPHRMLEGSDKKSWYLWGFSTPAECYFECRNTRSGDVASELLVKSRCEVLLTDVFSGYPKATREANLQRLTKNLPEIINAFCNAHARRYFFKCLDHYEESRFYLDAYHEIYRLNAEAKEKPPDEIPIYREKMRPLFEAMRVQAQEELKKYPKKNRYHNALAYYLGNFVGLTVFLTNPDVNIDNNSQESHLRSPVVGRKTWYVALGKVWTKGIGDEYILKLCNRSTRVRVPSGQSLTNRPVASLAG